MSGSGSKMKRRYFCGGIAMLVLWSGLHAQTPELLSADSLRFSTLQFNHTLQTFLWNGILAYRRELSGIDVDFRQTARSRLIRGTKNAIQDEIGSNLAVSSSLSRQWGIVGLASSSTLSDNQQIGLGNLSRHRVLSGPEYRIQENVDLGAMAGYEWASQEQARDEGFSYLGRLRIENLPVEEFSLALRAGLERSLMNPRTIQADSVSVWLRREFSKSSTNRLSFFLTRQQREFYLTADSDIQKDFQTDFNIFQRKASEMGIADTLEVILPTSALTLSGGILSRTIDRNYRYKSFSNPANTVLDTRIRETRLFGSVALTAKLAQWLQSRATVAYEEREERHSVAESPLVPDQAYVRQDAAAKRLANLARRTSASLDLTSKIGQNDLLNFTGSASILRYDTPDSLNTDDRDELLLVGSVEEIHQFSSSLALTIVADAALSHLVYLNRLQSANNNWNRVFRLRSTVDYNPGFVLQTSMTAEVLANYTVYDFEEQVLSVKSFSFRQASWSDSTVWRLGKKLFVTIIGKIRLYERGVLKWKEFKERPENYFVEQSYWPQIAAKLFTTLDIAVGFRFFSQSRYRYEGRSRRLERTIENSGPTVSVSWRGKQGGSVMVEGWREAQHVDGERKNVYSNMSVIVGMVL